MAASERADYASELCRACIRSVQKLVSIRRMTCHISPKKPVHFWSAHQLLFRRLPLISHIESEALRHDSHKHLEGEMSPEFSNLGAAHEQDWFVPPPPLTCRPHLSLSHHTPAR